MIAAAWESVEKSHVTVHSVKALNGARKSD